MNTLIIFGWGVFVIGLAGHVSKVTARSIVNARALSRELERCDEGMCTERQMRMLLNGGDSRGPIERHHDTMIEIANAFTLAILAMILWFFGALN